jgi:steroid delta-isomerase
MSIQVLLDAPQHPARDAAIRSARCVQNKDREGWLALWAEDGFIEDPVGSSPLDPEGKGHRGIEAVTAFYDNVIDTGDVRFCIRQTFACGNECLNVGTITTRLPAGAVSRTELAMLYRIDDEGKVVSLRAFWEFADMAANIF